MNINQKINARSWYQGEIHPWGLIHAGIENGRQVITPVRVRIHAPYKVGFLGFTTPRHRGQYYLTEAA